MFSKKDQTRVIHVFRDTPRVQDLDKDRHEDRHEVQLLQQPEVAQNLAQKFMSGKNASDDYPVDSNS